MKTLYKAIIQKLEDDKAIEIYKQCGVKKTRLIDEYEGQYLEPENFELLNCPFVLVEYDITYETDKKNGTLTLVLHLGYEQTKRANNRTINIDKHLEFFNYTDAVHRIINNLETPNTGKLELVSENSLKEPAITKVHTLTYSCSYSGRMIDYNNKYDNINGLDVLPVIKGSITDFSKALDI